MSVLARFRAWLVSVEFAVTATSVVVGLVAGALAFAATSETTDAYFVVILAAVAVPNIYADAWTERLDSRLAGVAWALLACLAVVACFLLVAAGLRTVAGETTATATGFVVAWLLGLVASRAAT